MRFRVPAKKYTVPMWVALPLMIPFFALFMGIVIGAPYYLGMLITHFTHITMWATVPIAVVFLFATGLFKINFTAE